MKQTSNLRNKVLLPKNEKEEKLRCKVFMGKYDIHEGAKKWVFQSISNAWRKYKNQLYKDHFEPYENDEFRMENRPVDVPDSQFRELLRYWNSDTYKEKKKETSESLSSKDIFVATRKRKPDRVYKASYVDTLNKIAEMDRIQSTQETEDDSQSVDAFASIMGPEHPGRLILYGRGVTKTSLKRKVGDIGTSLSSTDEILQQKMVEM
uniref:Uncharacterized protein LOC104229247 isoform X2 n=1 Tax=Nicotiana sylvestris TaxID=4096 RepID=A0A1U7WNJ2_NICSY|nr:PREDICTED: uncharacterized protein LOC104229247 isoform X2 [Nicotiana sylvestris]